MITVLMLDLGDTLVRNNQVLPHVPQALEAFQSFVTAEGAPLEMCVISDYVMPPPPVSPETVEASFEEYLGLLEGFGLRGFFEPVEQRVTLSTHAGVTKPDQRVFRAALERLGSDAAFENCLFITEHTGHVVACRDLGMETLCFGPSRSTPGVDFDDWSQAPELVAGKLGPGIEENRATAVAARVAAERNLAGVAVHSRQPDGTVEATAKAFCTLSDPALRHLDGIQVELPVDLRIHLDEAGKVRSVDSAEPGPEQRAEAAHYVKTLLDHGQVSTDPQHLSRGATHVIETDAQGRRILRRKRFSAR
jgi:hypothetical protein